MAAICAAAPLALANQQPLPTIVQGGWSRHCRCKYRYRRIRPLPLPFFDRYTWQSNVLGAYDAVFSSLVVGGVDDVRRHSAAVFSSIPRREITGRTSTVCHGQTVGDLDRRKTALCRRVQQARSLSGLQRRRRRSLPAVRLHPDRLCTADRLHQLPRYAAIKHGTVMADSMSPYRGDQGRNNRVGRVGKGQEARSQGPPGVRQKYRPNYFLVIAII